MIGGIFRARECAPCSLLQFTCEILRVSMTTGVAKYPVVVTSWVCSTAVCDGRFVLPSNRCNSCVSVRQQYEIAVSHCCRTGPTDNDYFIIFCLCDPLPGTNNRTPGQPDRGDDFQALRHCLTGFSAPPRSCVSVQRLCWRCRARPLLVCQGHVGRGPPLLQCRPLRSLELLGMRAELLTRGCLPQKRNAKIQSTHI